jgi:predicted XRE-type DNA-binding protein
MSQLGFQVSASCSCPQSCPRRVACELGSRDLRNIPKPDCLARAPDAIADTPDHAAGLRARADLMRQTAAIVKNSGWTQAEAAGQCGVTQPRMNDLLRGRVSRSMHWNIATAIGRTVHFDLRAANKAAFGAVQLGA